MEWIAALIKTYVNFTIDKSNKYWLTQSEIRAIANQLCTKNVQPARTSQWCNADHPNNTYNYLRANKDVRRLTKQNEFYGKREFPSELPSNEVIFENSGISLYDLIAWYKDIYSRFDFESGSQNENVGNKMNTVNTRPKLKANINIPNQSEVRKYLDKWSDLENYTLQEEALDKLYSRTYPKNTDINDVLIKVASLNDFYSTNIFSVFPVAKHIVRLNIDDRLLSGDETLVNDISSVTINGVNKNFYSFATKYCSHHNPHDYPIYDSYVDKTLTYFMNIDNFIFSGSMNMKDFLQFKKILLQFRKYYDLERFSIKEIDRYLWLLGKEAFPPKYKNR